MIDYDSFEAQSVDADVAGGPPWRSSLSSASSPFLWLGT